MPEFSQCTGIGSVLQFDGKTGGTLEGGLQFDILPAEVWGEDEALGGGIQTAREADADAFIEEVWVGGHQVAKASTEKRYELCRVGTCRDGAVGAETGVDASEDEGSGPGPDVDAKDGGALGVKAEQGGFASSR
jgi:hypothetical protein